MEFGLTQERDKHLSLSPSFETFFAEQRVGQSSQWL